MLPGWQLWPSVSSSVAVDAAAERAGSRCSKRGSCAFLPASGGSILRSWPSLLQWLYQLYSLPPSAAADATVNPTGPQGRRRQCSLLTDGRFVLGSPYTAPLSAPVRRLCVRLCDVEPCRARADSTQEPDKTTHTQRLNTPSRAATL